MRRIDADAFSEQLGHMGLDCSDRQRIRERLRDAPTVEGMSVDEYEHLQQLFSNLLDRRKLWNMSEKEKEGFKRAVLACKSVLHKYYKGERYNGEDS